MTCGRSTMALLFSIIHTYTQYIYYIYDYIKAESARKVSESEQLKV